VSTTSTAPVGQGFYISQGDNCMFHGCKAWYSRHSGFYVRGTRNSFSACQAQDNYAYGWEVTFGKNSFSDCHADSNGQAAGAGGLGRDGWRLTSDSNILSACQSYDRGGQAWVQQNGFSYTTGFSRSKLDGVTWGNAAASVTGTLGTGTVSSVVADAGGK
jgi:hypothetical protein